MTAHRVCNPGRGRGAAGLAALVGLVAMAAAAPAVALAQPAPAGVLRIIAFGAHPDDCELVAGGVAAKWSALGHKFKCVAVTNGDIGHAVQAGGALARRRLAEARRAARILGIETEVLDNHDGELMVTLENRRAIARLIRGWNADIVISHRPNDYHPDHRYAGVLVMDAAYMVQVPFFAPDVPPLARNPVFLFAEDRFRKPNEFSGDIVVDIDDVVEKKLAVMDAMESQFFEGGCCDVPAGGVPTDATGKAARAKEVRERFSARFASTAARFRGRLAEWYGPERAAKIRHAEAFEVCEYGRQPTRLEIASLFPFFPAATEAAGGDWVPLFNGKDLAGWKAHGAERWVVDAGEILGETLTKEYGYLSTNRTYRDFELKLKFKAEGTGNSGVFYHSTLEGTDIAGVQAEVDPRPGMHSGGLYESAGRGWLIKPEDAAEKAMRVGEWNDMRVLVRGPHVRTWVNGVPAVDYVDATPKYTDGVIALQLHSGGEGRMRFKDIVVREIK
jgi:N-acetylglucosamine malate deacetylase 1